MSRPSLIFGADGGGTKTAGLLADADGVPLSRHVTEATNPNVVGVETAAARLAELIHACCAGAGRDPSEIDAAVLGLAGAGTPAIRDRLLSLLIHALHIEARPAMLAIETDARIALEGAFGGGAGAIVIAGTGSVVLGKTQSGDIVRTGGWGRVLGDEGSGYFLGLEAVRLVAAHIDGRADGGVLASLLSERFGLTTRERIIVAVYQENFALASVAPLVLDAAERGDPAARAILERGAADLASQAAALAPAVADQGVSRLSFFGGLIDHDTVYSRILRDSIERQSPGVRIVDPHHSPAEGAVLLAIARIRSEGPGV